MSISTVRMEVPAAAALTFTEDALVVRLADGRSVSAPLTWYPRLLHAAPDERDNWELFGEGRYVHWPDLDEDLTVEALLAGGKSGESPRSLQKWLDAKRAGQAVTVNEIRPTSHA